MKLLCKRKLLDFKMDETQNPTEFFNDFEKLLNKLKNAGERVTEDKLNYLLLAIPESLSHIVDIVDTLPIEGNSVEYVKSKLLLEFQKRESTDKNVETTRQSQAFISAKDKNSKPRQRNQK